MRRRQLPGEPEPPSKGELKRRAHALQDLGEQLVDAPDGLLEELPLPEKLRDAVEFARRITSRAALVRQKQYIGKLMRQIDEAPIRAALEAQVAARGIEALRFRRVEQWRDRIVAEGDSAVDALLAEHPGIDADAIRRLAAEARQERTDGARPRAARQLFRLLGSMLAAT